GLLPEEFCYGLQTDAAQEGCIRHAGELEDDSRIRSMYRNVDAFSLDLENILDCIHSANEVLIQWGEAYEPDELKSLYLDYYGQSQECSGRIESANENLGKIQSFFEYHEDYLYSQHVDTEGSVDSIIYLKGEYSTMVLTMQDNLDFMSSSANLTEQEQQDLDSFQQNLSVIVEELE
ncbi:MAG: hypothetical protein GY852_01485, partial [bacterium]|nr:hypothetical protein [bacterium]